LRTKKKNTLATIEVKKKERETFATTVPEKIRDRYESIREKKGGVAIVPLSDNSCGGCQMGLTPNIVNEIIKAKVMVLCDSCSRILYNPAKPHESETPQSNPAESQAAPSS